ncbi:MULTISPECIES: DeoR family transcriptional regulator [unclassified Rhodococcus (in: high G+C Gram-positive bacteria)]|uniref:DeoR/GlpR family DNA-binding transcription regulator n=1 Tax=Rhodococcus sp. SJ-3 TaxID=3454628 RepID=UPI003F7A1EBA
MYAEERQQAIADLVGRHGRVSVADLADRYDVTSETVRRDLALLERLGHVRRVHGGAVPTTALTATEPGLSERENTRAAHKDRIAAAAARFLPGAGGSVILDAGTTTSRIAAVLPSDSEITVATNSVPIASRLAGANSVNLHLIGGRVRGTTQAAVGPEALRFLDILNVDVAFIGTNALTIEHGLSTPDADEAAVKSAMVHSAERVVVVADSSKIGRRHLLRFAPIDAVDVLVTDTDLDDADHARLTDHGIEVVTA